MVTSAALNPICSCTRSVIERSSLFLRPRSLAKPKVVKGIGGSTDREYDGGFSTCKNTAAKFGEDESCRAVGISRPRISIASKPFEESRASLCDSGGIPSPFRSPRPVIGRFAETQIPGSGNWYLVDHSSKSPWHLGHRHSANRRV